MNKDPTDVFVTLFIKEILHVMQGWNLGHLCVDWNLFFDSYVVVSTLDSVLSFVREIDR